MMMNLNAFYILVVASLLHSHSTATAAAASKREDPFARWRHQQQPPTTTTRRRLQEEDDETTKSETTTSTTTSHTDSDTTTTTDNRLSETSGAALYDVTTIQHAPPPAPHLGKKTVLVTGAAGFVGSHTAETLLKRGDRVIVLDEVNDYYNVSLKEGNLELLQQYDNVVIYRGDIANATLVQHIFETEQIAWVVHLAARAGVRPSIQNPFHYIHSNILGSTTLLEMATRYGVKNFVQASSSSVYGGSQSVLFDEQENVDFPISPYAASKRSVEYLGMYYARRFQLPVTSLRFFTVYGPRGRPDMAPFLFVDWMARGQTIRQFGDGSSSRDYTFVDDIVQGVVGALDRPSPAFMAYYQNVNLGKGSGTSLRDFVQLVAKYVGKKPQIQILPDQPGDVPYTCANVTVAHVMLNYTPTIPFETGIQQTVAWYKSVYPYSVDDTKKKKSKPAKDSESTTTTVKPSDEETKPKKKRLSSWPANTSEETGDSLMDSEDEDFTTKDRRKHRRLQETPPKRHLRRLQVTLPHKEPKKVLVFAQQESASLTEHVVEALSTRGDTVAVIVPSPTMHEALGVEDYVFPAGVSTYTGCVDNSTFLQHVLQQEQPQWIAYLNALTNATESKSDPDPYIGVNVRSFVRLLQLLKDHNNNDDDNVPAIENIVLSSTSEIYEQAVTDVWHAEADRIDTVSSPLAATLKSRELMAHTWHALYRIPTTALRLPRWYGPGDCPWCTEQDDDFWEYMYVADVAEGVVRALDRPYPYQIMNLGQGPDLVEEGCQSRAGLKAMVQAELQGDFYATARAIPCALAKADKAQTLLDFVPQTRLREGIRHMAQWYRHHPEHMPSEWRNLEASSSYPTLPWSHARQDQAEVQVEHAGLPAWVQGMFQLQWVVVACFLLYKGATWGRKSG